MRKSDIPYRAVNGTVNAVITILIVIALVLGLFSWYTYRRQLDEAGAGYAGYSMEDLGAVGWITIDHTDIDYPVMQGKTNTEYLSKSPLGAITPSGSIFLDSMNRSDMADPYMVIYGHHMEKGRMFGALDAFHDRSYLRKHSRGTLKTRDGRKLKLHVYACLKADARDRTIFDVTQDWGQKRSELKHLAKEDHERVLALSTCMDAESAERTVVLASVS